MVRQRRRDTAPEMAIRRLLHGWGLRYRVDAALPDMRRRADLLFPSAKVAVFVDGCFWHGCPVHGTQPKSNAGWWAEKLAGNIQRDRDTDLRLGSSGWRVVRVWEHEAAPEAARRIADVVRGNAMRAGR
ncbi:MAG: DNA mismatch endonuclease Vsr [Streptosporangiaceae bacterium]|nr:DNA mismatch endonuclease Vsr [Streptosporangiaceae bacterium]